MSTYVLGLDETARNPKLWQKVADDAPSDGQVLTWVAANSRWEPKAAGGGVTLSGDVSGAASSNTVDKVKNIAWLAGTPTDRQIPTYDNGNTRWEYQWPGITNFSENKTFTILPAGSSVATINTALTDYDVVYLEPGDYSIAAGETIAIGSGKALIGLGNAAWSDTGGPKFTAAAAKSNNWIQLNNGYLGNVTLYTAYDQTTDIISGNTTNCANICERICVETSAERNVAAFVGGFLRIENIRVGRCNGIYLSSSTASGNLWGPTVIRNFKFNTCTVYGIYMMATNVEVSNGLIDGDSKKTDYGIVHSGTGAYSNHWINNVYIYNCGEGVHYEYTTNRQWRLTMYGCRADSCTIGFYLKGIQEYAISNCSTINCVQYGFYLYDLYYGNVSNCTAINSNGTAGLGYGNFVVNGCYYITLTGLNSYGATNTNNCGLYVASSGRVSISAYASYTDVYGIYVDNSCADLSATGLEIYSSTTGVYVGTGTGISMSNISLISCATAFASAAARASYSNITVKSPTIGSYPVSITGNYTTLSGLVIHTSSGNGLYVTGSLCSISNLTFYSLGVGIYNSGSNNSYNNVNISNCSYGYYNTGGNYCSVTGLNVASASNNSYYSSGQFCSLAGFVINNCTATGINLAGNYGSVSGGVIYYCSGASSDGVYVGTSLNVITGVYVQGCGRYGFTQPAGLIGNSYVNCVAVGNSYGFYMNNSSGGRWNSTKACGDYNNTNLSWWGSNWDTGHFTNY